ncbi:MAG TPA: FG-GAP-like repeat-containing protein, partial [Candidatus Latescibacteria bacterium]|nr:FG-GAP-like repeat-containing protein [Candidatus Latescibacterota bacterium]
MLAAVFCMLCGAADETRAAGGEWPMYRQNPHQTGRTDAVSRMREAPVLRSETYLGGPVPDLAGSDETDSSWVFDFDGDGRREQLLFGTLRIRRIDDGALLWQDNTTGKTFSSALSQVADFLPDSSGLEVVAFTADMGTGEGRGYMFSFHGGISNGRLAWSTPNLGDMYSPEVVAGDFNNDGKMEICLAPHYKIQVLDAATGFTRYVATWDVGRNYGHFAAADVDGDGIRDFVVISDFATHLSVIKNAGSSASLLWKHTYALVDGSERDVIVLPNPHSVGDLDGDGTCEVTLSLFNRPVQDLKWHATAYRGADGTVAMNIPDRYIYGIRDADNDGVKELFTIECFGTTPPLFGKLQVFNWTATSGAQARLTVEHATFVRTRIGADTTWNTIAAHGDETVLLSDLDGDGIEEFLTLEDTDGDFRGDRLRSWQVAAAGISQRMEYVSSAPIAVVNVHGSGAGCRIAVRNLSTNALLTLDAAGNVLSEDPNDRPKGYRPTPVVSDLDGDGRNEILVTSAGGDILCYDTSGPELAIRWRRPGYAMIEMPAYTLEPLSVLTDDLDGDGKKEVIARNRTQQGFASLIVYNYDGTTRWEHPFPEITDGQVEAAIDNWLSGYFVGDDRIRDIVVQLHARARGSGELLVLNGATGAEVWRKTQVTTATGATSLTMGGYIPAIHDVNGDGIDDIVHIAYTLLAAYDGQTGNPIYPIKNLAYEIFPKWVSYATPTVADFRGTGQHQIFMNSPSYAAGAVTVMEFDGTPRWWYPLENPQGFRSFSAIGDGDGDGVKEIVIGHLDGRVVCYQGTDGAIEWTESVTEGGTWDFVAADIDGDGRDEFITVLQGNTLVAYNGTNDGSEPRVQWSLPLGAGGNNPVVADVDNDGVAEILICVRSGYMRIYEAPPRTTGLLKTQPYSGAVSVERNAPIEFLFDELMDSASVASSLSVVPPIPFHCRWEAARLIINTDAPMDSNTTYRVTIGTAACNRWGMPLGTDVSVEFTTGTGIRRLQFRGLWPHHRSLDMQATDFIRVDYSRGVEPASVADAVRVDPPVAGRWQLGDTTASFIPLNFWKAGRYRLTVFPTAHDGSGQNWDVNGDGS